MSEHQKRVRALERQAAEVVTALNHYCSAVTEKGEDSKAELRARLEFDDAVRRYVNAYLGWPVVEAPGVEEEAG